MAAQVACDPLPQVCSATVPSSRRVSWAASPDMGGRYASRTPAVAAGTSRRSPEASILKRQPMASKPGAAPVSFSVMAVMVSRHLFQLPGRERTNPSDFATRSGN